MRLRYWRDRFRHFPKFASKQNVLSSFSEYVSQLDAPRVLELGTARFDPTLSSMHPELVPNAAEYLGLDIVAGEDVDIVADVHRLSEKVGEESFDVIISCSSFEHFKYPQLAAHELMKTLKIGGVIFIQTHQSFPLHAAPNDYYRFSREALASLFGLQMGMEVLATDYEFPARIRSREMLRTKLMPAFLNSRICAVKRERTPADYRYDLDDIL